MRIPSDQTHLIHALENLTVARRELWESIKNDPDNLYMESVFESIDDVIKHIARRIE
jgi:uncharacterized damage-inducible protein DinB